MEDTMAKSFSEVYDILLHIDKELYKKIPKGFIEMLKNNMDNEYKCDIDYTKDINDQELLKETKIILSLIYRDYICTPEKRKELLEKDKIELLKYEQEIREKYNPDNIFKNRNKNITNKEEVVEETKEIVEYKENVFKRILSYIKNLFK